MPVYLLVFLIFACISTNLPCAAKLGWHKMVSSQSPNSQEVPTQILRTGINLSVQQISPNTRQLADILKITPLLKKIQDKRESLGEKDEFLTIDDLRNSHRLALNVIDAMQIIQEANLAVDFTLAEISAEQNVYTDILGNYQSSRDKAVFKTNALSFITNGALWAVCEGLDIPTYARPRYSISSGTTGILAGIIPSVASAYALYQLDGKHRPSEVDPNMLAKIFNYPINPDIDYPNSVWQFLNSVPADERGTQTRRDLLIERWVTDKNIPNFTDRSSKDQLDVITASVSRSKGLSIATLNVRQVMLKQLSAEILKMKRMLLELSMVVHGEKRI